MTPKMNIIILMYVHENDTNLHIFGDFLKMFFPPNFLCFSKSSWFWNIISWNKPFWHLCLFYFCKMLILNTFLFLQSTQVWTPKNKIIKYWSTNTYFWKERFCLFKAELYISYLKKKKKNTFFYCFDWILNIASFMPSYTASA